jgi:hypothetical protein
MDKHKLKGIAERKLDHMRHGSFRGGLNHFIETGTINGTFLEALNGLVEECAGEKPDTSENTLPIESVSGRFPEKEALEKEVKMYATSIINETDYNDKRIHLEYAFKAGINYLNEFMNDCPCSLPQCTNCGKQMKIAAYECKCGIVREG